MYRQEWGEIVGDTGTIEADLRWTLFQAERSIIRMMEHDSTADVDHEILERNLARVRDAKTALAAVWAWYRGD